MIEKKIIFTAEDDGLTSYIHLKESLQDSVVGESVSQIVLDIGEIDNGKNFKGELVLDLNKDNKLIGIEIIGDVIPGDLK